LYYALFCGHIGLCKYLIARHGTDVNAEYGTYASLLHAVLAKGNLDAISLLLDLGADVNMKTEHKRTPLCEAYRGHYRRLEVMRLLLERGAAPDVWYDDRDLLLHKAIYIGEAEVIHLLIQHNADVDAPIHSNHTPLHWASSIGNTDIAQILLECGANINALSDFGTPLFHASLNGHLQVAQLLLVHGADVHIRALGRPTPFHVATEWGMTILEDLLSKHGAEDIGGHVANAEDDTIRAEQNQGLAASTDSRVAAHTGGESIRIRLHHITQNDRLWVMGLICPVLVYGIIIWRRRM
jgi:ankyrin repeat protein